MVLILGTKRLIVMKIGLITIHHANSYGGTLQAFATQVALSKYGEVNIIDYKSPALSKTMCLMRVGLKPRDILRMGKDLFRLFPRYRLLKKFQAFARDNFKLTESFTDADQMFALDKEFDVFVTGSDQIWNPNIVDKLDAAYLLAFAAQSKKISFASSAGSYRFSESEKEILAQCLGEFDHLAVREEDTASFLSALLGGRQISHVLDPTLLLTKDDWISQLQLSQPKNDSSRYLLVYTLKKDDLVRRVIIDIANRLKMSVVAIDQDPFLGYPADDHRMDASPRDFVSLVSGAAMMITNSFHGTTFAVNFGIPFVSVKPESGLNRMQGFLRSVDLESRLITRVEEVDGALASPVSFDDANKALHLLREDSFKYLDNALRLN